MRLPAFEYLEPKDLEDAISMMSEHGDKAKVIAGGSDLLARMKQRLLKPAYVVSLKNLSELNFLRRDGKYVVIGAMTPLAKLLESELIQTNFPALFEATRRIGAPPIQHFRGTIGGNLCLETRCLYYNQSALWRSGRTRCHKDNGETCYAEENSDRCRSANQSDGACALMALDAEIVISSIRGESTLPIEEFFTGKGESPFNLKPDELVTQIRLPLLGEVCTSNFQKLTYRSAIDFALVSSAVALTLNSGDISGARIAIGGAGASPLLLKEAAEMLIGKNIRDSENVEKTAETAGKHASAFMVENLGASLEYRQKMAGVLTKRAINSALEKPASV